MISEPPPTCARSWGAGATWTRLRRDRERNSTGERSLSALRRRRSAHRRRTGNHPTRQFAPAVPNAGFAPHCRRSDARGL